jgi:hypothetical protein
MMRIRVDPEILPVTRDWQNRRRTLRSNFEPMDVQQEDHINNLDVALKNIAKVGLLSNSFERSNQNELLRYAINGRESGG